MEFITVRRVGPGRFEASTSAPLADVVRSLVGEVRELLLASTDDPGVRRLFPPAYATDPSRDEEYQVLVRDDLLARRLASLDALEAGVGAEGTQELDEATLTMWMTAVNDVRLVLGTVLDVDEDEPEIDRDDPRLVGFAAYELMTRVLARIVRALHEDLPPPAAERRI
jgi:hypothetical protein